MYFKKLERRRGRALGLSKFVCIAHVCAHRLHVQERLVEEIVDEISRLAGSDDVAVVAPGEHLCMTIRSIQTPHLTTNSAMRGCFRTKGEARAAQRSRPTLVATGSVKVK
jgi:GTP cyclohydrolase IA